MKKLLSVVAVAIALTGCQSVSSPKTAVDTYLEALKKGDPQQQQEFSCHKKEPPKSEEPLVNVQKWEIVDQEPKTSDSDSDGNYQLVSVKVEAKTLGDFAVTRTWRFSVWKSDDFFESSKRFVDKWNRKGADAIDSANRLGQSVGVKPVEKSKPVVVGRDEFSTKPYCILRLDSDS